MDWFIFDLSILVVCAALLSYLAVLFKQPIIVAYIISGILVGPSVLGWINEIGFITGISRIGVTLLLFLAGLCLHPRHLLRLFQRTGLVTLVTSLASFFLAFVFSILFGFGPGESLFISLALMFSSTILVIKLLPTTKLHHGKIGALCIGILIAQDIIAISVLLLMRGLKAHSSIFWGLLLLVFNSIVLIIFTLLFEQFIIRKIMQRVDRFHEMIFIIGLGWCFGVAVVFKLAGLSYEIGAFFAGVAIARHPISLFISEQLKPLRDFFLVLFFFSLGARLNLAIIRSLWLPSLVLAAIFVIVRPWLFDIFLRLVKVENSLAKEASVRLGQMSEFSLLIAIVAYELGIINNHASQFIQLVTIFTIIASSYIVVFSYPTPIGVKEKLIQD